MHKGNERKVLHCERGWKGLKVVCSRPPAATWMVCYSTSCFHRVCATSSQIFYLDGIHCSLLHRGEERIDWIFLPTAYASNFPPSPSLPSPPPEKRRKKYKRIFHASHFPLAFRTSRCVAFGADISRRYFFVEERNEKNIHAYRHARWTV